MASPAQHEAVAHRGARHGWKIRFRAVEINPRAEAAEDRPYPAV